MADRHFGNFEWVITVEESEDPSHNVYRASHVEDDGLLAIVCTARKTVSTEADGSFQLTSSYNEPLFIGTPEVYARPAKVFCRLHELIARILLFMRDGAEIYQDESEDDEVVDPIRYEEPIPVVEKVNYLLFGWSSGTMFQNGH
jgi:hypothetical protein